MKIGLVCPYNMFIGGGVQEVVLALRDGIQARGHKAYIITPQPRDYKGMAPEGVIFIGGGTTVKKPFDTAGQIAASVDTDKLEQILEEQQFDILHFHEPWVPMLSRQILLRSEAINIGTFHATLPDRFMTRTIERVITPYTRSILKYLDVMTAVSPSATTYVRTLSTRNVSIIANGIDLKKYKFSEKPAAEPGKHKKILYVGRLEKRKGVKYLIQAFAVLRQVHPEYQLLIAGNGPDREKLEEFIKDNNIRGVSFLGYIDEQDKLDLLHEADIFCSAALYGESFGIVLLEAMASGCVTVAGNNAGYESVMSGRGQVSIVNPKDTVEFARRLALLGSDEELRSLWRKWARSEAEKYNYDRIIDQYMAVYQAAYAKKNKVVNKI
jgi:phosphatidylinositol alpha-mannosyltransferase